MNNDDDDSLTFPSFVCHELCLTNIRTFHKISQTNTRTITFVPTRHDWIKFLPVFLRCFWMRACGDLLVGGELFEGTFGNM